MTAKANPAALLTKPDTVRVKRTDLRQNQSSILGKAQGTHVVVVAGAGAIEEKYILSKAYFEKLLSNIDSLAETLQIMADRKLFDQVIAGAGTVGRDFKAGKLHSFEEAFGKK
jgi:hypothetical protein